MNAKTGGSDSENKYLPLRSLRQKTFFVIPECNTYYYSRLVSSQAAPPRRCRLDLEEPPVGNIFRFLNFTRLYIFLCLGLHSCSHTRNWNRILSWKYKLIQYCIVNRNVCPANWNFSQQNCESHCFYVSTVEDRIWIRYFLLK
jgi:hypothetical protein